MAILRSRAAFVLVSYEQLEVYKNVFQMVPRKMLAKVKYADIDGIVLGLEYVDDVQVEEINELESLEYLVTTRDDMKYACSGMEGVLECHPEVGIVTETTEIVVVEEQLCFSPVLNSPSSSCLYTTLDGLYELGVRNGEFVRFGRSDRMFQVELMNSSNKCLYVHADVYESIKDCSFDQVEVVKPEVFADLESLCVEVVYSACVLPKELDKMVELVRSRLMGVKVLHAEQFHKIQLSHGELFYSTNNPYGAQYDVMFKLTGECPSVVGKNTGIILKSDNYLPFPDFTLVASYDEEMRKLRQLVQSGLKLVQIKSNDFEIVKSLFAYLHIRVFTKLDLFSLTDIEVLKVVEERSICVLETDSLELRPENPLIILSNEVFKVPFDLILEMKFDLKMLGQAGEDLITYQQLNHYKALSCLMPENEALSLIQKKSKSTLKSNMTLDDIGGLQHAKQEIMSAIIPIKLNLPLKRSGILFYGPPGCGKTLIARAISNTLRMPLMHVKGPELINMYYGESERQLRAIFLEAKMSGSVLFFDELDALLERLSSQFLTEMDKFDGLVIGATNRPDLLDKKCLRPGRFDRHVYVPPPSREDGTAQEVLETMLAKVPHEVNKEELFKYIKEGFTGADYLQVANTAFQRRLEQVIQKGGELVTTTEDWIAALQATSPSLTSSQIDSYKWNRK